MESLSGESLGLFAAWSAFSQQEIRRTFLEVSKLNQRETTIQPQRSILNVPCNCPLPKARTNKTSISRVYFLFVFSCREKSTRLRHGMYTLRGKLWNQNHWNHFFSLNAWDQSIRQNSMFQFDCFQIVLSF